MSTDEGTRASTAFNPPGSPLAAQTQRLLLSSTGPRGVTLDPIVRHSREISFEVDSIRQRLGVEPPSKLYLFGLDALGGLRIGGLSGIDELQVVPRSPSLRAGPLSSRLPAPHRNHGDPSAPSRAPKVGALAEFGETEDAEDSAGDSKRLVALKDFSCRLQAKTARARKLLSSLESSSLRAWAPLGSSCDEAIGEVFRNRFWMAEEPALQLLPVPAKRRLKRKWRLDDSVWHARKLHGPSADYYTVRRRLTSLHWPELLLAARGASLRPCGCRAAAPHTAS